MRSKFTLLWCSIAMMASVALCETIGLKPGLYDVRTAMQMEGGRRREGNPPARHCITAAELKDPEALFNDRVLDRFKPDPKCATKNLNFSVGKVSYELSCEDRTVRVTATYNDTHFEVIRNVKPANPEAIPFVSILSGGRVGDCK